ncbi:MAG: glycosyltransferase family 39 protein [Anaerolineae bacterium]|nr:glycosyltransferase family 39 protein [Anaerolineae bacterium]
MRPKLSRAYLALIVLLLIGQFILRAHNITELPAFVDEYSHIRRARIVYDFDTNPARYSHGKLLLYYWLGLFRPFDPAGLMVARTANALFTLLGGAALAAVARDLFGRRAMIPALAFYALVPYAVFFDRMALADPFAGALAALAAWASLRLVRRPTAERGLWAGLVLAFAPLAKLTTAPVVALPLIGVLLFGPDRPPGRTGADLRAWIGAIWQRNREAWIAAGAVFGVVWGAVLIAALANRLAGDTPLLIDAHLIENEAGSLLDKVELFLERGPLLISPALAWLLVGMIPLLLWRCPRGGLYALVWLLLIWVPIVALIVTVQSRYLMAGVPALAVVFGGGIAAAGDVLGDLAARLSASISHTRAAQVATSALAVIVLVPWAVGFALPFNVDAMTDPAALNLPDKDQYDYFRGSFNTWGIKQGLDYLRANGERFDGIVPAVGVFLHCGTLTLHLTDDFAWNCMDPYDFMPDKRLPADLSEWYVLMDGLQRWPFVYLLTEYTDRIPLDAPPADPPLAWDLVYSFAHPHGGRTVAVWRVAAE